MLAPGLPPLDSERKSRNTVDASTDRTTTLRNVGAMGAPAGSFLAVGDGVPSSDSLASYLAFLIGGGPAEGRRRGFFAMANAPSQRFGGSPTREMPVRYESRTRRVQFPYAVVGRPRPIH